jgi:hypothetical protein
MTAGFFVERSGFFDGTATSSYAPWASLDAVAFTCSVLQTSQDCFLLFDVADLVRSLEFFHLRGSFFRPLQGLQLPQVADQLGLSIDQAFMLGPGRAGEREWMDRRRQLRKH